MRAYCKSYARSRNISEPRQARHCKSGSAIPWTGISEAFAEKFRKVLYDLSTSRDQPSKIPLDPKAGFEGVLGVDEAA
jgi:hypothetical protein